MVRRYPKLSLYRYFALPMAMLVLIGAVPTFALKKKGEYDLLEQEDTTSSSTMTRLLRGERSDIPDTETIQKLLDGNTSTSSFSSSRKGLADVLKPYKGKHHARQLTPVELSCEDPSWTQIGSELEGNAQIDHFGFSIDLSADGEIMAVGAPYYFFGWGNKKGYVKVYRRNIDSSLGWSQIGDTLRGEGDGDQFGEDVALSNDGTILAVGADSNDAFGNAVGHVRVFEWTGSEWDQIGQDIDGEAICDTAGSAVAINGSGDIVAIGATLNDGNNGSISSSGHVRVFQRAPSTTLGWEQIGGDIDGIGSFDRTGEYLALSDSGDIVAIGANSAGYIRVFKRDTSSTLGWVQEGDNLSGNAVALSEAGDIVATGATGAGGGFYVGAIRVYSRDTSSPTGWTQIGNDIIGDGDQNFWGTSVALSADGNILAGGAKGNQDNGWFAGHVRVFRRDPSSVDGWVQIGTDIDGEREGDYLGTSVALSKNGEVVAVGAPYNDGDTIANDDYGYSGDRGQVRVYEACDQDTSTVAPTYTPPPPPPCQSGDDKLLFQILTDNFGYEITWKVQIKKNGDFQEYFGNGAEYGKDYGSNRVYQEKYCIPDDECYRFIILDSFGDGLCCTFGQGGYRITWDNVVQKESQFKDKDSEFVKFNCD